MAFIANPKEDKEIQIIVGLGGASGSGKTWSAMEIATGLAGGKKFYVIDTESGRARHYKKHFNFDRGDLTPPFTPRAYLEALETVEKMRYPVVVIDSMSHVWMGDGGCHDWHESILDRMAGDDYKKRDACNVAAWVKPKMAHKQMIQKFLRLKCHLVLCFRAEEKTSIFTEEKDGRKKTTIVNNGWQLICEKHTPYELTMSIMLAPEEPGKPNYLKLQKDHLPIMQGVKLLNKEVGEKLLSWASENVLNNLAQKDKINSEPNKQEIPKKDEPKSISKQFSDEAKIIKENALKCLERNDVDVLKVLTLDWYRLCYKYTTENDGFVVNQQGAEGMHAVLMLEKPLSIQKGYIDFGGDNIVHLDEVIGVKKSSDVTAGEVVNS